MTKEKYQTKKKKKNKNNKTPNLAQNHSQGWSHLSL